MRKILAGPAISLGGVAESPAEWRVSPPGPADREGVPCLSFER